MGSSMSAMEIVYALGRALDKAPETLWASRFRDIVEQVKEYDELFDRWVALLEREGLDPEEDYDAPEEAGQLFEEETGLEFLGAGRNRAVFALDHWEVIKLAMPTLTYENRTECAIWIATEEPWKKWLAPILSCDAKGRWLIMVRAEMPIDPDDLPDRNVLREISRHTGVEDIEASSNWGYVNERPVIIDYAYTDLIWPLDVTHPVVRKLKRKLLR